MADLTPKTVKESAVNGNYHVVFGKDLNNHETAFGGGVVAESDIIAAIAATQHSGIQCVTKRIDPFNFDDGVRRGEILIFYASVNRVWRTSMEVGVKIFAKHPVKNPTPRYVASGYFTFVNIGADGKPTPCRPVIPETDEEKRRYDQADLRRQSRLTEDKK